MSQVIRRLKTDRANFVRLRDLMEAELSGVENGQGHVNYSLTQNITV